jgi:hypothetical protein
MPPAHCSQSHTGSQCCRSQSIASSLVIECHNGQPPVRANGEDHASRIAADEAALHVWISEGLRY